PSRRQRHWAGQHLPNCAASQRFDRLYFGGWTRYYLSHRIAARSLKMITLGTLTARPVSALVLVSGCALFLAGCPHRQLNAKPFPWSTCAYSRPVAPAVIAEEADATDLLAEGSLDVTPPPSPLVLARAVPPRPRVLSNPAASSEGSNRPEVPQIAQQLTPAEANAAQQPTNQSVSAAKRNLGSTEGKTLNATQQDLASKVRSFLAEARDAAQTGDWTRARNAAKKAEVLSQELARSL